MKKCLSLVLALVMMLSLSVSAGAAEITALGGSVNKAVTIQVDDNGTGEVYSVQVDWGNLAFEYNMNSSLGEWDPENHQYDNEGTEAQGWQIKDSQAVIQENIDENLVTVGVKNTITVSNHSNAAVKYTASYVDDNGTNVSGITMYDAELPTGEDLAACAVGGVAPSHSFAFGVTGTPGATTDGIITLGTLTITIAAGT